MSTRLLCDAIAARVMVSFTHQGQRYTVEPHSVGYDGENDQLGNPLLLRAWHDGGWRDFQIKFMSRVESEAGRPMRVRSDHQSMTIVLCDAFGKDRT